MRFVIAPDKFKGSLTAEQVCDAVAAGIADAKITCEVFRIPMADGGEGTADILTMWFGGRTVSARVSDPLGRPVMASYGMSRDGTTAFMEMSAASGLQLLQTHERNPLLTTSFGTGEMIRHAAASGARDIVLGIGGSATNDMGIGMAAALGYRFTDSRGVELKAIGSSLLHIARIHPPEFNFVERVKITVLCDVANPLYGLSGAAHVFANQKGADAPMINQLDNGLRHLASLVSAAFQQDLNFSGAGAAGGMGAGCKFFLGAELRSGIEYIMHTVDLESAIRESDLVITGEGRLDEQSLSGKVVAGVTGLCSRYNKRCLIITGQSSLSPAQVNQLGNTDVISLSQIAASSEDSIANAAHHIAIVVKEYLQRYHV